MKRTAQRFTRLGFSLLLVLLAGCGGGSGTSTTPPGTTTYTVGGTISSLSGSLTLQNNASDNLTRSADGAYAFPTGLVSNASYSVRVLHYPLNQDCSIANASGIIGTSDISNVDVSCQALDPIALDSVDSSDTQGDNPSTAPSISTDGRYIAFASTATNLVSGDTNNDSDIFLRDRLNHATVRISVDSADAQATLGNSTAPDLSSNGRYIAFTSAATNLVPNDTNTFADIFLRDQVGGSTHRVSVDSSGLQANDASDHPSVSDDGVYVAFESLASNLVTGDGNTESDVFIHNTQDGSTILASVDSNGTQGNFGSFAPRLSSDGNLVVFESDADNLVTGDSNTFRDIFVHNRTTGATERVSVSSSGGQANGVSRSAAITPDGRYVVFVSSATNLAAGDSDTFTDIYRHDRQTGETLLVSVSSSGVKGNGNSDSPSISADGRFVSFESAATNLVSGDSNGFNDVFVRDMIGGTTSRQSVDASGNQAILGNSSLPVISDDGNYVTFASDATNLVTNDQNSRMDVFTAPAK